MRATILAALAAAIVLLVVAQQVIRAQTGPLPLVSVFELHLLVLAGRARRSVRWSGRWARAARAPGSGSSPSSCWSPSWSAPAASSGRRPDPATGDELTRPVVEPGDGLEAGRGGRRGHRRDRRRRRRAPGADARRTRRRSRPTPTLTGRYPYRILDPEDGVRAGSASCSTAAADRPRPGRRADRSCGPACCCPTAGPSSCSTSTRAARCPGRRPAPGRAQHEGPRRGRPGDPRGDRRAGRPASALVVGDLNGTSTEPGLDPLRGRAHGCPRGRRDRARVHVAARRARGVRVRHRADRPRADRRLAPPGLDRRRLRGDRRPLPAPGPARGRAGA